jgi:hypothetical protein
VWDEIVDAAAGTKNEDDVTCAIVTLVGRAFSEQGLNDAALATFKEALRSTKRDTDVLNDARYWRADHHARVGSAAKARGDLERVIASDPAFLDARERLQALSS